MYYVSLPKQILSKSTVLQSLKCARHCSEGNNDSWGGRSQWKRALMRKNKSCFPGLIENSSRIQRGQELEGTNTASNYGTASEFELEFAFPFPLFLVLPLPNAFWVTDVQWLQYQHSHECSLIQAGSGPFKYVQWSLTGLESFFSGCLMQLTKHTIHTVRFCSVVSHLSEMSSTWIKIWIGDWLHERFPLKLLIYSHSWNKMVAMPP